MKDRIKLVRKAAGDTQEAFAEKIGITKNYLSQFERGVHIPNDKMVKDICREYGVDYDWLVYGGDPEIKYSSDDGDAQAIIDRVLTGENQFAKDVLLKFAKLDTKYWDMIEEIIEQLKE